MNDYILSDNKKKFLALLLILALLWGGYTFITTITTEPTAQEETSPASLQDDFINFILERSETGNATILQQRQELLSLYQTFNLGYRLSLRERHWLTDLAVQYQIDNPDFNNLTTWNELLKRVDIIPNSLVIAQAIQESGWGRSRFAEQGNNYFGMWCYGNNCGLTPANRPDGQNYGLQTFPSALASVENYMNNLNTHFSYIELRDLRQNLRENHQNLTGLALAPALVNYSSEHEKYVNNIISIINNYHLTQYDDVQTINQASLIVQRNMSQQFRINELLEPV